MKAVVLTVFVVLLAVVLLGTSVNAQAIEQTSTGFYYPTGVFVDWNTNSYATWLAYGEDYLGCDCYHIGWDIVAGLEDPVYAIADGEVIYVSPNGWGTGNEGLLVRHALIDGTQFVAVYGHVRSDLLEGDAVAAGQQIAIIGPWSPVHLHFGVHPGGDQPPDPYGALPGEPTWPYNDWENPIAWITSNYPGPYHIYTAFSDDFEDGDAIGWYSVGYGTWKVENGTYRLNVLGSGRWAASIAGNPNWADYTLKADVTVNGSGSDVNFWVRCNEVAGLFGGNCYSIAIRGNPVYDVVLLKYIQHTEVWRQYYSQPAGVWPTFHLATTVIGDQIQISINGTPVVDYTDAGTELTQGNIALGGYNVSCQFDNIEVRGPSDILPSMIVTVPNDGGFLRGGSTAGVNWTCLGPRVDHIRLQCSRDNGATYADLGVVQNTGHYDWTVPSEVVQDAVIQARAESADNTVLASDRSDKSFPILPYYVAFTDDFNDGNDDGWNRFGAGTWSVVNGAYQLDISNAHWVWGNSISGNEQWTDYVWEVDFKGIRGVDKGFQIRHSPAGSYYIACLVPWSTWTSGQIVLVKYQNGVETWRQTTAYPFANETWYHLSIAAVGARVQACVNGTLIVDAVDQSNPVQAGLITLGGFTSVWNVSKTLFDNVTVWGDFHNLLDETVEQLPPEFNQEYGQQQAINQGQTRAEEIINDYVSKAWRVILNWPGSELALSAYRPNGSLYGQWQSSTPPLEVDIVAPDSGNWTFEVTAIDVPYDGYPFALVIGSQPLGSVSGTVSDSSAHGLLGVTVDIYDDANELLSCTTTDGSGHYAFPNLVPGQYSTTMITPLGFVADAESKLITVSSGADSLVDFVLTPLHITPSQRGMGFWKHQVNVHLTGRGNAQVSRVDLSRYLGSVSSHFNNNPVNPIDIYVVDQPANGADSLSALRAILTVNENASMNERAEQHLMALLLNVVSGKLSQMDTSFSEDGLTVSQAITYGHSLLMDSESANDELAKGIAETINNGFSVPAGTIPLSTPNISYKGTVASEAIPLVFELHQNYPNPFNAQTVIAYALPEASHVSLSIYNLLGQKIATLADERQEAGEHQVTWRATDAPSGMYFYRIATESATDSQKMLLVK